MNKKGKNILFCIIPMLTIIIVIFSILFENKGKWTEKKFVTFGDSITWYDGNIFMSGHREEGKAARGYQYYMRTELGCSVINEGSNGKTMPEIWEEKIKSYNFNDVDAVTLTSGANDFKNLIPLGSLSAIGGEFDVSTYYGSIQMSIESIKNSNPKIKIYLITPIKGWYNEEGTTSVPNPNAKGMMSCEYANAIVEIGCLYDIPVCDWFNGLNFKESNISMNFGETVNAPYYLHPTNYGYSQMGKELVQFLKNN